LHKLNDISFRVNKIFKVLNLQLVLFLIEDFGPKAVGYSCVNVTASNICKKGNKVSRQAIAYHRSGY